MKSRPRIWIIVANVVFIACITTLVVIAVKHRQPEVPVVHER